MKYFYIFFQAEENGKRYAGCIKAHSDKNLWYALSRIDGIQVAQIMPTKREAYALVDQVNTAFRNGGVYLFDTLPDGSPAPLF